MPEHEREPADQRRDQPIRSRSTWERRRSSSVANGALGRGTAASVHRRAIGLHGPAAAAGRRRCGVGERIRRDSPGASDLAEESCPRCRVRVGAAPGLHQRRKLARRSRLPSSSSGVLAHSRVSARQAVGKPERIGERTHRRDAHRWVLLERVDHHAVDGGRHRAASCILGRVAGRHRLLGRGSRARCWDRCCP